MVMCVLQNIGKSAGVVRGLIARFKDDQSGNYLVLTALLMPVLIESIGLGTDFGVAFYKQQAMQGAADSAAISAATASANLVVQANAVTASYGFVSGSNGVTV